MKKAAFKTKDSPYINEFASYMSDKTGLIFKVYNNKFYNLVEVMARTKPIQIAPFFKTVQKSSPAPWTNRWWARLIRWAADHGFKKIIPIPILSLAEAKYLWCDHEEIDFPDEVLDNIQTQMALLKMQDREPTRILIGRRCYSQLEKALFYSPFRSSFAPRPFSTATCEIWGLPMEITDRIEENGVLVIA